jgi:quinol monooxygenase YgiN
MCATSSTTQSWSWPPDAPPPSEQGGEDKPGRVDPDTLPKNVPEHSTELVIIARFRAREGNEEAVAAALRAQVPKSRNEPGCLEMGAYASTRDPRLFFIHSQWRDEAAFDAHAQLPNTLQFVEQMERLIDHPFDVSRTRAIA